MKRAIMAAVISVSLLMAGPAETVLAGSGSTHRAAVNAQTTLVLKAASKVGKTTKKPVKKPPVSRGDRFDSAKVIRIAVALKGTPYRSRGQTPDGFDCSGFTRYVFKAGAGIELPRSSAEQARFGVAVSKNDLRPGDLVYFNTSGEGISHVGIYIGGDNFISSTSSSGVQVTGLNDDYWGPRYKGGRRVE